MTSIAAFLGLIGAIVIAIAAAWGYGRHQGAKRERTKVEAKVATTKLETERRIDHAVQSGSAPDPDADRQWLRQRGRQ